MRSDLLRAGEWFSLSPRERARVRGKSAFANPEVHPCS
jgi:hypothetical protein